jgi:hypothetical protein
VTADGRLLYRDPVRRDVPWTELTAAKDVIALAGAAGMLFGVTRTGALLWRDPYVLKRS